jgi:hypothetical protein
MLATSAPVASSWVESQRPMSPAAKSTVGASGEAVGGGAGVAAVGGALAVGLGATVPVGRVADGDGAIASRAPQPARHEITRTVVAISEPAPQRP